MRSYRVGVGRAALTSLAVAIVSVGRVVNASPAWLPGGGRRSGPLWAAEAGLEVRSEVAVCRRIEYRIGPAVDGL